MARETELKFQVPRGQRGLLRQAVAQGGAHSTRLQAVYADTAGQHLAAAGMALRLRKEGRVWVQTLKGRGDGLATRFEHEVVLRHVRGLPALDASLHSDTALGPALQRALAQGGALLPVYRTDIQRLHRRLPFQGAVIELALDRGHLIAGARREAVHEIEFELVSGPPTALPALAAQWAQRHRLWWDVRTKSERGYRLAHRLPTVPAVQAPPPAQGRLAAGGPGGGKAAPSADALSRVLSHALPNAAELAGGSGGPQHAAELHKALQSLASQLPQQPWPWAPDAQPTLETLATLLQAPAAPGRGPGQTAVPALLPALLPEQLRQPAFTVLMLAVLGQVLALKQPAPG